MKRRRIGSLRHCIALGAADIGEAVLEDGRQVHITWGRNIPPEEREKIIASTTYDLVVLGHAEHAWAEFLLRAGPSLDALLSSALEEPRP